MADRKAVPPKKEPIKKDCGDDDMEESRAPKMKAKKGDDKADDKDDDKDGADKPWEKASKRKAKKSDEDLDWTGRDDDKPSDDQDDDADEDTEKSAGTTVADLEKSLKAIHRHVAENDRTERKDNLLSKAMRSDLSKGEQRELMGLLSGADSAPSRPSLGDSLHKSMDGNADVSNTVDISDYVAGLHEELNKSLRMAGQAIEALDERQNNYNLLQAKVTYQMGGILKSIDARLAQVEGSAARAPKSQGVSGAQPLNKSFSGQPHQGEQLNKSQVLDVLDDMVADSYRNGGNGLSKSGEDLTRAVAKYEQLTQLSPNLAREVREFHSNKRAAR